MRILAVLGISLLLFVCLVSPVSAGVDPHPFKANQLNAVAHQLEAINAKLDAIFQPPPDDSLPNPKGLVGMLRATANRLDRLYDRVEAARPPPDDNIPALTNVRDAAQEIVDTVEDILVPPDPCIPPPDDGNVLRGLGEVQAGAQAIVDLANLYIPPRTLPPAE